ncbi:MAG: aquaporin [Hyphomicrobiaceae bacterium]|nr:aquaporin [Hyphomicrobiaceae bacterium]
MLTTRALAAEAIGTALVVLATLVALKTALISGGVASPAAATLLATASGTALTLAILAFGPVSGGHFNPAVTLGLVAAGRFETRFALPYVAAQVAGGLAAGLIVAVVSADGLGGRPGGDARTLAAVVAPSGLVGAVLAEALAAFVLLIVITTTATLVKGEAAPALAAGLAYGLVTLLCLPVTQAGINPARATAALAASGPSALGDLWLFWVAPVLGGTLGALAGGWLAES